MKVFCNNCTFDTLATQHFTHKSVIRKKLQACVMKITQIWQEILPESVYFIAPPIRELEIPF